MTVIEDLSLEEKLTILSDAAKYDVACTSSGVDRKGKPGGMGNTAACGICHSFAADGRCISLLKILYTNACIYDCAYCINRSSNDTLRTAFTPEEVCELTMQFYRRNYIEGLFLSSGIRKNPTQTMEEIYVALRLLREVHHFNGYIHVKAIPGADPQIIGMVGFLADRMSTNLELPTAAGLKELAPNKTRKMILSPLRQIQQGIGEGQRGGILKIGVEKRSDRRIGKKTLDGRIGEKTPGGGNEKKMPVKEGLPVKGEAGSVDELRRDGWGLGEVKSGEDKKDMLLYADSAPELAEVRNESSVLLPATAGKNFVPAGQSTQMIVGATPESDYQVLTVAEALYKQFDLKRVFYSAYVALNADSRLPALETKPPLLREHRLYQADWLLRFYGFEAGELLTEERPDFNVYLDPKCEWALRHLEYFPVEINRAPYQMLLRIPGVGVKSARRIVMARKNTRLDFDNLKRIGVVLKRAHYFITCNGRMMYPVKVDEDYITRRILEMDRKKNWELDYNVTFRQLSLFDDRKEVSV
ncbi:MAG: putative DNA modification/repair radical SAM protein [Bacteroidales bacterium]|nr:putative DNA modification/repair radical SAM protein [Clostridium sp.]MCM1202846.1 putative DNA modification/repair radical SAM protein [Bacteroidales bacterium]